MNLIQMIKNDKEIQQLKAEYKKKYNKNAPPYDYDQNIGLDAYKMKLKELLKQ